MDRLSKLWITVYGFARGKLNRVVWQGCKAWFTLRHKHKHKLCKPGMTISISIRKRNRFHFLIYAYAYAYVTLIAV